MDMVDVMNVVDTEGSDGYGRDNGCSGCGGKRWKPEIW